VAAHSSIGPSAFLRRRAPAAAGAEG